MHASRELLQRRPVRRQDRHLAGRVADPQAQLRRRGLARDLKNRAAAADRRMDRRLPRYRRRRPLRPPKRARLHAHRDFEWLAMRHHQAIRDIGQCDKCIAADIRGGQQPALERIPARLRRDDRRGQRQHREPGEQVEIPARFLRRHGLAKVEFARLRRDLADRGPAQRGRKIGRAPVFI